MSGLSTQENPSESQVSDVPQTDDAENDDVSGMSGLSTQENPSESQVSDVPQTNGEVPTDTQGVEEFCDHEIEDIGDLTNPPKLPTHFDELTLNKPQNEGM
jgi:hypothetical protein